MTSGAIHVAQVPESGWPCPLPPPLGCNLSTNRKRKPKWRRCVAASIVVGPSAILTGSRTRPSDWGSNARFGPVEDQRNNRRLATFTCTLCVLQIWWLSPFTLRKPAGPREAAHEPIPRDHPRNHNTQCDDCATTGFLQGRTDTNCFLGPDELTLRFARHTITPAWKKVTNTNPTRQRGKSLPTLAGASGWYPPARGSSSPG